MTDKKVHRGLPGRSQSHVHRDNHSSRSDYPIVGAVRPEEVSSEENRPVLEGEGGAARSKGKESLNLGVSPPPFSSLASHQHAQDGRVVGRGCCSSSCHQESACFSRDTSHVFSYLRLLGCMCPDREPSSCLLCCGVFFAPRYLRCNGIHLQCLVAFV